MNQQGAIDHQAPYPRIPKAIEITTVHGTVLGCEQERTYGFG